MVSKYESVAINAARLAAAGTSPTKAWEAAAEEAFVGSPAAQKKSCPKGAFLGLASAGHIRGVPAGEYTASVDNRGYAEAAVCLLKKDPFWTSRKRELWHEVAERAGTKKHNSQMDVVIGLWNAGLVA